jgi:hypothetical protein
LIVRLQKWQQASATPPTPAAAGLAAGPPTTPPLSEIELVPGMPGLLAQLDPLTETQLRERLQVLGYPSNIEEERRANQTGGRYVLLAFAVLCSRGMVERARVLVLLPHTCASDHTYRVLARHNR